MPAALKTTKLRKMKRAGRKPRKKIFIRDRRLTEDELLAQLKSMLPVLRRIIEEATAAGEGVQEKLKTEIWKRLPTGVYELNNLASAASLYNSDLLRGLALQKLACLLTAPNRRKWSWSAWQYSQALQQLFPVWRAGFLREFRLSFPKSLTPAEIHDKMSNIRSNIIEEFGFRTTYVIAKHRKTENKHKKERPEDDDFQIEDDECGKTNRKSEYTSWHVHGFLWPWRGPDESQSCFKYQYSQARIAIQGNKWVTETFWRSPNDLPRSAAYLAYNYHRGCQYRKMLCGRHRYKHPNEPFPTDAAKGVRLYSVPEHIWIAQESEKQTQCRYDRKYDKPQKRKDNPDFVPWNSLRATGRLTPISAAYRAACVEMAKNEGLREERAGDKFDSHAREQIFQRACSTVQDLPRVPSVVGYDGFIYQIVAGNALWFETHFYLLVRQEVAEDYTLLPQNKTKPNHTVVPKRLGQIAIPVSLFDLHKLGQAEVSIHVPPAQFRPVSPITGKLPKPICRTQNIPRQVSRAARIDGVLEAQWMRRAKKKKPISSAHLS